MKRLFPKIANAGATCSRANPPFCPPKSNSMAPSVFRSSICNAVRSQLVLPQQKRFSTSSLDGAFILAGARTSTRSWRDSANKLGRPALVRYGSSWELHPGHGKPSTEECNLILSAAAHKLDVLDEASIKQFTSQLSDRANHVLVKVLLQQACNDPNSKINEETFKRLDKNSDGKLSKEEFLALAQQDDTPIDQPTFRQLILVMATSSVPFIGFGLMDNSIMILAGEAIEVNLGAVFSLTTMGAAATGNMISDVAGVGLGSYIESIARRSGFTTGHGLSPEQMEMKSTRFAGSLGAAMGVSLGCFLGMFPLLFLPADHDKAAEKS